MIAAGGYHSLALTSDQKLYSWGSGKYGQTGAGDFSDVNLPRPCASYSVVDKTRQVSIVSFAKVLSRKERATIAPSTPDGKDDLDPIKQICAGGNHSMFLTESGAIYSFGYGAQGQLGLGLAQNFNVPTLVKSFMPLQVMGFTEEAEEYVMGLALGQNHSIALSSEGLVYTCGAN